MLSMRFPANFGHRKRCEGVNPTKLRHPGCPFRHQLCSISRNVAKIPLAFIFRPTIRKRKTYLFSFIFKLLTVPIEFTLTTLKATRDIYKCEDNLILRNSYFAWKNKCWWALFRHDPRQHTISAMTVEFRAISTSPNRTIVAKRRVREYLSAFTEYF